MVTLYYTPHHYRSGAPIKQIDSSKTQELFAFKYYRTNNNEVYDSIFGIYKHLKMFDGLYISTQSGKPCKIKPLANPEKKLIIHKTSPYMGYGLVTKTKIKKCTLITEYTGEIISAKSSYEDNTYTMDIGLSKTAVKPAFEAFKKQTDNTENKILAANFYIKACNLDKLGYSEMNEFLKQGIISEISLSQIDAIDKGNIARFIQYMPSNHNNPNYLTANTASFCSASTLGRKRCFIVATRDIKKGEELGLDYGENNQFKGPKLFFDRKTNLPINPDGTLLNPNHDYPIIGKVESASFSHNDDEL